MKKKEEEISISLEVLKKRWAILALFAIIIFGFYLRSYHLDYPVIGYHNWKESRYLEEARNFADEGFFKHGFFVPEYDYPPMHGDPSGAHGGEFPTLSILVGYLFMILGPSLLVARVFVLLLSLGTIIAMYLLVKELFDREDIALTSALAAAMMPLLVFFTHNVDVINIGLLLMLLGGYYYVRWVKHNKAADMMLSSLFIMLSAVSKYEFLVIGIPMLFIFPWRRVFELGSELKSQLNIKKLYPYIISLLIFLLVPAQYVYSLYLSSVTKSAAITGELIDVSVIFTSQWWQTLKAYTADNYTILGFYIALLGVLFLIIFYQRKSIGYKFMLGYLFGTVLYFIIMSKKLGGHSYHQYPVAPFFAVMIAYCLVVAATNISGMIRFKILKPLLVIIFFAVLYIPSNQAWDRQFDTQFFGLDIAGEYINANSVASQRIIHSGHQDYGILWHADRKGIDGGIPNASEIRWSEDKLNVSWIFIYQWGFDVLNDPGRWKYIKEYYSLKQLAVMNNKPLYMLLKRGGSFNESMLNNITAVPLTRKYELTTGDAVVQYVNFE